MDKRLEKRLIDFYWRLDDTIDEISLIGRVSQNEEVIMLRDTQKKLEKILADYSPTWVEAGIPRHEIGVNDD